ncbi:GAF and ANTAR domain-containing protein [Cellulomonas sp. NS3]|uniref:GAF and ANTAR domain-containing protein n=1 Tax=Cellulomonas sp. NS3 TaxID=2973977 RepID=UPI002161A618|nr:GAF and ANTAR domain-containing protein [Cellulomonas sp. NS3]
MTTTKDDFTIAADEVDGHEHEHAVTGTGCVERFLEQLPVAALQRVVPSAHVVISVQDGDVMRTVASSDPAAEACERTADERAEGPSAAARRQGRMVVVPDVEDDTRWPRWADATRACGFRSVVAVPGRLEGEAQLLLTLYSPTPDAWDGAALATAVGYAQELAHALTVCRSAQRQAEVNSHLKAALASRATIDQAMGVIMAQNRCSAEDAFAILRTASQHRNTKLRDVAVAIIEGVTGQPASPPPEFRDSSR